jgi:hypothetical protein
MSPPALGAKPSRLVIFAPSGIILTRHSITSTSVNGVSPDERDMAVERHIAASHAQRKCGTGLEQFDGQQEWTIPSSESTDFRSLMLRIKLSMNAVYELMPSR